MARSLQWITCARRRDRALGGAMLTTCLLQVAMTITGTTAMCVQETGMLATGVLLTAYHTAFWPRICSL